MKRKENEFDHVSELPLVSNIQSALELLRRGTPFCLDRTLTHLNFSNSKLGGSDVSKIVDMILSNSTVTSLSLFACPTNNVATVISSLLMKNCTLTHLDLGRNDLTTEDTLIIADALSQNCTIKSINLGWNKVTDTQAIGSVLVRNTTLTSISLIGNDICNIGAFGIYKCLQMNNTLTSVDLGANKIYVDGAKAIATVLANNFGLTHINLGANEILDEGANAIASALTKNTTLVSLNLQDNLIGVNGCSALIEALKKNTTLTSINLSGWNHIDKGSLDLIKHSIDLNKVAKLTKEYPFQYGLKFDIQSLKIFSQLHLLKKISPSLAELPKELLTMVLCNLFQLKFKKD